MDSPRPSPADKRGRIEAAKSALRDDAHAGFETQAPHLRQVLENLPLFPPEAAAPPRLPVEQAARQSLEELLGYLSSKWIAHHPSSSHEGAIHLDVSGTPDVLTLTFSMYLWGKTIQVLRFVIARMAQDAFLCWTLDQNALYEPSEYHTPIVQDKVEPHWQAPDFPGRLLTWLQRRGWATHTMIVLIYVLVYGVVGAIVGGLLGALWGFFEWGDADAVLVMGGTWALTLGALGATAGLISGLWEARRKD